MGLTLLRGLLKQRYSLQLDRLSLSLRLLAVHASFLHASLKIYYYKFSFRHDKKSDSKERVRFRVLNQTLVSLFTT